MQLPIFSCRRLIGAAAIPCAAALIPAAALSATASPVAPAGARTAALVPASLQPASPSGPRSQTPVGVGVDELAIGCGQAEVASDEACAGCPAHICSDGETGRRRQAAPGSQVLDQAEAEEDPLLAGRSRVAGSQHALGP